jgi:xanthine dehydrogenase accessory factor
MAHIYASVAARLAKKRRFALAVIIGAQGSVPQGVGAAAIFTPRGLSEGTVGGGALEAAVGRKAAAALRRGRPLVAHFALGGETPAAGSPICGGRVGVLIDPRPESDASVFLRLGRSLAAHRGGVLVTSGRVTASDGLVLRRDWIAAGSRSPSDRDIVKALAGGEARLVVFKAGSPSGPGGGEETGREFLFLEPVVPPERLVIAGAGHIGRAVCHLGRLLEFEVTIVDDRRAFANRKNLPDADRIIRADIGKALRSFPFDRDAFVVIVTRGHARDADALRACVRSEAGYIGMVGSRTKVGLMRREFLARGWATAREFDRVRAPIGLAIGSRTVPEIAVSIAAQLIQARRALRAGGRKNGRS